MIASTAAFTMAPGMAAYAASKAAVEQFANACGSRSPTRASTSAPTRAGSTPTSCATSARTSRGSTTFEKFPGR